jgi:hypothetical protein
MKKNIAIILLSVFTGVLLFSCKCQKNGEQAVMPKKNNMSESVRVIAPVVIYKTNADFYNNVPVMLNDAKTDIVSYPDIVDVFYNGKLAYPTRLENGYLLDNRGISKNTAFLKYTYEEYSKLSATPTKEELLKMIISKNPLIELYNCNKLPKNNIQMLNEAIKKGLPNVCENLIK